VGVWNWIVIGVFLAGIIFAVGIACLSLIVSCLQYLDRHILR
jgi:Ni/Fe-hydrogenase subunit HybB-like protein